MVNTYLSEDIAKTKGCKCSKQICKMCSYDTMGKDVDMCSGMHYVQTADCRNKISGVANESSEALSSWYGRAYTMSRNAKFPEYMIKCLESNGLHKVSINASFESPSLVFQR